MIPCYRLHPAAQRMVCDPVEDASRFAYDLALPSLWFGSLRVKLRISSLGSSITHVFPWSRRLPFQRRVSFSRFSSLRLFLHLPAILVSEVRHMRTFNFPPGSLFTSPSAGTGYTKRPWDSLIFWDMILSAMQLNQPSMAFMCIQDMFFSRIHQWDRLFDSEREMESRLTGNQNVNIRQVLKKLNAS